MMVDVRDVTRTYGSGPNAAAALRGVTFTVGEGALVALRGRSGSGKTTLLNIVGGLDLPDAGQVRVGDVEARGKPAAGHEIDVRNLGRPEDLVGDRLLLIDGRDRLGRVEVAGHRGPQEALRQARLGVVVDQKHAPAGLCQRACKVIADRGFANPAFLVQGRDDGHAIPSLGCWITPQVSARLYPVYKPFREIPRYPDRKRVYPTGRERPSWVIHRVYGDRDEKKTSAAGAQRPTYSGSISERHERREVFRTNAGRGAH